MLLIDNQRVSDRVWGEDAEADLDSATRGDDEGIAAEAYACIFPDGTRVGPHHEVQDGVLIVNRQGVYQAIGAIYSDVIWRKGEKVDPDWPDRLRISQRADALAHLRRHSQRCDEVAVGE